MSVDAHPCLRVVQGRQHAVPYPSRWAAVTSASRPTSLTSPTSTGRIISLRRPASGPRALPAGWHRVHQRGLERHRTEGLPLRGVLPCRGGRTSG